MCSILFCAFLFRCFERLQRETSRNLFMEEMSYVLSFTFFSMPLIFSLHWWPLAFLILSPPLHNFHVVLPTKKMSPLSFLSPFFTLNFADLPPTSLFLGLSLALYSKFVDMTINLSLILWKTRIKKQFPLSADFVFIDCLAASVLQDAGGYAISRQNKLELHLDCHTSWLSYFTLVCLCNARKVSRAVGVRSRDYQIFSDG